MYGPSIQTEFNLVLPKLKELKVTGSLSRMRQILESYPGVLDKLQSLEIGVLGDATLLQVSKNLHVHKDVHIEALLREIPDFERIITQ